MTRRIILYIAMSLDGFIAREDGSIDWLGGESSDSTEDFGFDEFNQTIDTILIGRSTYEQVVNELSPDVWPYQGKRVIVFTRQLGYADDRVQTFSGYLPTFVEGLRNQPGLDIWLAGGGKQIEEFLQYDLIDQYVISVVPVLLGKGIRLFKEGFAEKQLHLNTVVQKDGLVQLTYQHR